MDYKIVCIRTRRVNVYLVIKGNLGILVDPGARKYLPLVHAAILGNGLELQDIRLIILTHTHYDHVDGLKEISEQTGARILVHKNEAGELANGYTRIPRGTGLLGSTISFLGRTLYPSIASYDPVEADIRIEDRYEIEELGAGSYILHTPGHTHGSISFIAGNEHAFVGDSLFGIMKDSVFPPFADNVPELIRSWQLLADTGCHIFYPGHGRQISRELFLSDLEKFKTKYG